MIVLLIILGLISGLQFFSYLQIKKIEWRLWNIEHKNEKEKKLYLDLYQTNLAEVVKQFNSSKRKKKYSFAE